MHAFNFIASETSIVDERTRSVSVINIMEGIHASSIPVVIPKLALVVMLRREPNEPASFQGTFTAKLDSDTLFSIPTQVDFQDTLVNRQIVSLQGIVIAKPGKLTFVFELAGIFRAEHELPVTLAASPPGQ